jgi:hypothetical protein
MIIRLDLLTFDYEEARKPGKAEAPEKGIGGHIFRCH